MSIIGGSSPCKPDHFDSFYASVDESAVNFPTDDSTAYFSSGFANLELRHVANHQGPWWPMGMEDGYAAVAIVIRMNTGEKIDLGIVDVDAWCQNSCIRYCEMVISGE